VWTHKLLPCLVLIEVVMRFRLDVKYAATLCRAYCHSLA